MVVTTQIALEKVLLVGERHTTLHLRLYGTNAAMMAVRDPATVEETEAALECSYF